MPNIKSAVKRVQVAERNRQRNMAYKSAIRTAIKKVLQGIENKEDKAAMAETLKQAYSLIDRAVLKGILKKNTGARYKSRVAKAMQKAA
ncbi:MAG: 30S ribosomal protein S20 [Vampirovibrio sp.]|nr:30S ribosomal protein S20 [Vampirovibrio sp.]